MKVDYSRIKNELTVLLGDSVEIKPLQGGAINLSFSVSCRRKRYFLKYFDASSSASLNRTELFSQQIILAKKGMAPMPLYLSNQADFQLEQWIDGQSLSQSVLSEVEKCQRLAQCLVNIHQLDIVLPPLSLDKDWQRYLSVSKTQLSAVERGELVNLLHYWQTECDEWSAVCHNDLSYSHVMVNEDSPIFDWEYAAISSPLFDIASCCIINQLNGEQRQLLVLHYASLTSLVEDELAKKVCSMLPVVHKTYDLWARAYACD